MGGLVRHHASVRLLQGGAATGATDSVRDPIHASAAPLSLRYITRMTSMALIGHCPLMVVIQILTTLVYV